LSVELFNAAIKFHPEGPNPKNSKDLQIKFHSTESKAFSKSSRIKTPGILLSSHFSRIKIDDSEFLISLYADDSTLILEDDTQSLNHALEVHVVELFMCF
jgi:hypothetical protein